MKGAFRLWGLENERFDLGLSLLTVLILSLSRYLLLASGPWEWDETLFARGMLHFELAAHFPHPPGFPGWLAIGRILLPFAGTPLRALQLASASFSILALWPLALLGRRVAPPAVATSAALFVLFLPGPWLFAVRGFSSTAAASCIFFSALLLCRIRESREAETGAWYRDEITRFTLLLTAAFLIRPILLPPISLLWIAGAWIGQPRRRIIPGALLGTAAIGVSILVMMHLEGGWVPFARAFVKHARHHSERLYLNGGGFGDLGLVKGVGGPGSGGLIIVLSLIGLWIWAKDRGKRAALVWVLVLAVTILQLFFLQNRSYARYAVPVQIATAPLLAGAAGLLSSGPAAVFLLAGATVSAAWSLPILKEQHTRRLAAWEATEAGESRALEKDLAFVVGPEIHPFASYLQHLDQYRGRALPEMLLSPRALAPWQGTGKAWVVATIHPDLYLPSLNGVSCSWGGVSPRLEPLTQQRFLSASLIDTPPLPLGTWWSRNETPDGQIFMWAGPEASMLIPPLPRGSWIGISLRPAPGPEPLEIIFDDHDPIEVEGDTGATRSFWFLRDRAFASGPSRLQFHRASGYPPGHGDERPLSVQVFQPIIRIPGEPFGGSIASREERERLGLGIEGAWPPEDFGPRGRGVWLKPQARLRLNLAQAGELHLKTAAPRPTPPETRVALNGGTWTDIDPSQVKAGTMSIHVARTDLRKHHVEIEIQSRPYRPSSRGSSDRRQLGIVLYGMAFIPDQAPSPGWWSEDRSCASRERK